MNEKVTSFANRLKKAMNDSNISQAELSRKSKIDKSLINKYLKGVAEAGNDNLPVLAETLQVNVVWLMGYDVPSNYIIENNIVSDKENFETFERVLKSKGIIDENDKISQEDFDRLMTFIDNNKELLIKKDRD